jgi:hypothetical protein
MKLDFILLNQALTEQCNIFLTLQDLLAWKTNHQDQLQIEAMLMD